MLSFAYNLGGGIFTQYPILFPKGDVNNINVNSMLEFVNKGSQFEAGLTRRRKAEIELFNKPVEVRETKVIGGQKKMWLINSKDKGYWYVTDGVTIRYIKTERALSFMQKNLGMPVDVMYQAEIQAEWKVGNP